MKYVPNPSEIVFGNVTTISADVAWDMVNIGKSFEEVDHYNIYFQGYEEEEWADIYDTEGIYHSAMKRML